MRKVKRNISICLSVFLVSALALSGCGKKEEEVPTYEMVAYQENQLMDHTYYVKTNSGYYPVAPGIITVGEQEELIPEVVSNSRIVWFGPDDQQIPTLYKDQSLVYVSSDIIPEKFVFERYEDLGYTIGIKGLYANAGGKYETVLDDYTMHPLSSAYANLAAQGIQSGTIVGIDKIGTTTITSDFVTRGGTISGLTKGQVYNVDIYRGSDYLEDLKLAADTHAFVSYEIFETSAYDYKQSIFVTIKMPDYLLSGYYYVNGCGLFRYVANAAAEGINGINFNQPYYVAIDENGNLMTQEDVDRAEKLKKQGEGEEGSDTGSDITVSSTTGNTWSFIQSLDNTMEGMDFFIHYEDEKKEEKTDVVAAQLAQAQDYKEVETEEKDPPQAMLISPDGQGYEFTLERTDEDKENGGGTLMCSVTMPISGDWKIDISGMEDRIFTVQSSINSGHSNSVVHSGTGSAEMNYYLGNAIKDAQFEFTWENAEHAAVIEITTPSGKRCTANENDENAYKILYTDYGQQVIGMGTCIAGNYTIRITGEELGRVRCVVSEKDKKYEEEKKEDTEEKKDEEEKKEGEEEEKKDDENQESDNNN